MLDGIDLVFETGGYTLISGPTGSGKSTLALALAGALAQSSDATVSGRVTVHGRAISDVGSVERSALVAAVWQRPDIQLFRGTMLEEVLAPLDYRLAPPAEGLDLARQMLRLVGLDGIDERRDPATLSGGEQQRLALAAALAQETPVLVLDEATSALDRHAALRFGEALDRARSLRTITIIAIDHRADVHRGRADRCIVLDGGRVVEDRSNTLVQATPQGAMPQRESTRLNPAAARPADCEPAVMLTDVEVQVGGARLLRDVSLHLRGGAVVVLTGDNGAGKSTLLRLLAAELRQSRGTVRPGRRRRIRSGIGYAPQRSAELFFASRVCDEIESALSHGARTVEAASSARAGELLRWAGLDGVEEQHPLRLSGGQRQRLAVLLALVGHPRLVLLDEPSSAQDVSGLGFVTRMVARDAEQRVTVIATHDPAAFASLATHRVDLADGRVVGVRG